MIAQLSHIEEHLGSLKGVRFEWSLKVSAQGCLPRKKPIIWVGQEGGANNERSFKAISNVLQVLDCPDIVRAIQEQFSATSKTQGFHLDLEGKGMASHGFYVDYVIDNSRKMEAFHWKNGRVVKKADYSVQLFNKTIGIEEPLSQVHPGLKGSFIQCCKNERLITESAFVYQFVHSQVNEVYLTYYWHPTVRSIVEHLPSNLKQQLLSSPYADLPFRHIGFSTIHDEAPELTFYFCAPLRRQWPNNFYELQKEVNASSRLLAEELNIK